MAVTDPATTRTQAEPSTHADAVRPADAKSADRAKPLVRWGLGHALPRAVMLAAARKGDFQGQLIKSSRTGTDVLSMIKDLRERGAVHRGKFAYLTASLPAVRDVLSSNDFRVGFEPAQLGGPIGRLFGWAADTGVLGPLEPPSLLVTNPPDHTRYRKLVTRVFTARAVEKLRERTEQIATELLDEIGERAAGTDGESVVELVESYCTLLPVTVIAEILGVPASERDRVLAFGGAAAPSLDLGLTWKQFRTTEAALAGFDAWLGEHLGRLRANPGDDLLSQLVTAEDDGVGLTERELKATAGLVLAAGFETTVNLLGNGVALLCEHRDQLDTLRAEPELWPNAVDEVLRYDPPVLLTGRTATTDTEIRGTRIPAGALITTLLAGANRDPEVFTDPDRFDVRRENAKDHVSFSAGRHFCLGASLARMEGDVGLRMLFDRYPELTLASGARRRDTRILRGYAELPVRLRG